MNNKETIQETEILLDETSDTLSNTDEIPNQNTPDNALEEITEPKLTTEDEEVSVEFEGDNEETKPEKSEDVNVGTEKPKPHPPIKPDHEPELTHLLREAGRFLHPGPKDKLSQKEILMIIKNEKEITQRLLADKLHKSPAAISEIVRKLNTSKLVKRIPNKNDRRVFDLELTEKGQKIAQEFEKEHPKMEEDMYSILTGEEREELTRLLKKLITNWRETRELPKPPVPPKAPVGPVHKPHEKPVPPELHHGPSGLPVHPEPPTVGPEQDELEVILPVHPELPVEPSETDFSEEFTFQDDLIESVQAEENIPVEETPIQENSDSKEDLEFLNSEEEDLESEINSDDNDSTKETE